MAEKDRRLDEAREAIQGIDREMAALFERRMEEAGKVAAYKKDYGLAIHDPEKEEEKLREQSAWIHDPDRLGLYQDFLRQLMRVSREYEEKSMAGLRVSFSGTEGAYADMAADGIYPQAKKKAYPSFKEAYQAVLSSQADLAILPLENSSSGEVRPVMDLLFSGPLYIESSYQLPVRHSLLAFPTASLSDIHTIVSHPQALAQCQDFIQDHGWETLPFSNTALAARYVKETADPSLAAIASDKAGRLFGLESLASDIAENSQNTTRFAVVGPRMGSPDRAGSSSHFVLLFTVRNQAGALAQALEVIGNHGFNLNSLRSCPMKELMWQYYFFAEAQGNIFSPDGQAMLEELAPFCDRLKVAGSFQEKRLD